jgi:WD40 repeat protein
MMGRCLGVWFVATAVTVPAARSEGGLRDNYGDPLPPGAIARLGTTRLRHGAQVNGLAFSARDQTLASAGQDGNLVFWDARTGRAMRQFPLGSRALYDIALSSDGSVLAVGGEQLMRLLDARSGKELRRFTVREGALWPLGFGAKDRTVFSAGGDGVVRLWDTATGKELRHFGARAEVEAAAVSPDGKQLARNSDDGTIVLHDTESGKELARLPAGGVVSALAFSHDGKALAAGGRLNGLVLWDLLLRRQRLRLSADSFRIRRLAWAPDDRQLISVGDDAISVWDTTSGAEKWRQDRRGETCLTVTADGKVFATAGGSGTIRLWDVARGTQTLPPQGHEVSVSCLAYSADGRQLASGAGTTVFVWDLATGKPLFEDRNPHTGVDYVAFSPDGRFWAATGSELTVRLWPVAAASANRPEARALPQSKDSVAVAFAPDGKTLAAVSSGRVGLWDTATARKVRDLKAKPLPEKANFTTVGVRIQGEFVAFAPDGKLLAASEWEDGTLLWDLTTGKEVRRLREALGSSGLTFTPDGKWVLARRKRGGLALWRVTTGTEGRRLADRDGSYAFAMSPDGRLLAWSTPYDADLTVHLVEVWTGREFRRLPGHRGRIHALAFSPDSQRLATGGEDTTVLVWDVLGAPRGGAVPGRGELERLWQDLQSDDAVTGRRAVAALVSAPGPSVELLRARLKPVPAPDPVRLERLLRDLSSDRFSVREAAVRELEKLGELAVPALQRLAANPPMLETQRRVEQLLVRVDEPAVVPVRLQELRALAVLEHVGSAEARRLLEDLAGGAEGAGQTREARAALRRLKGS